MSLHEVLLSPGGEMILESPFDNLMKQIRRDDLIDAWTKEVSSEQLMEIFSKYTVVFHVSRTFTLAT
jgi:hypothetical protein